MSLRELQTSPLKLCGAASAQPPRPAPSAPPRLLPYLARATAVQMRGAELDAEARELRAKLVAAPQCFAPPPSTTPAHALPSYRSFLRNALAALPAGPQCVWGRRKWEKVVP
jgi:hypothetical protein